MSTTLQIVGHRKTISCVTCSAPLPIGHNGEVQEPEYFACTSMGWRPENEGERDCEDIDTLCRHIMSVVSSLRGIFNTMALAARKDLDHDNLGIIAERHAHLEEMRSLCHPLNDLQEEAERKVKRLREWVCAETKAEEAKGGK